MEWFWNIWDFIFNYLIWTLIFLSTVYKTYVYLLIKKNIAFPFDSVPEISELSRGKKAIITTLFIFVFLIIIKSVFSGKTVLTIIPFLIIVNAIYIRGKLIGSYFSSLESIFYYNESTVLIYPIFVYNFKRFVLLKWKEIQSVEYVDNSKTTYQLIVTLKSNRKIKKIIIDKNILFLYLNLFKKYNIEIINEKEMYKNDK